MPFIDSNESKAIMRQNIDLALMVLSYYEGNPYDNEFTGSNLLRASYVSGDDEFYSDNDNKKTFRGPGYDYEYNIARDRIERMVHGVVPPTARFVVEGVEDKAKTELMARLFNFGPRFDSTENSVLRFIRMVIRETAKLQDGLIVIRQLPEAAEQGKPPRIRFNFYPSMNWQAEIRDGWDEEVDFYRVEKKEFGGTNKAGQPQLFWHRMDIYRDRVQRYAPYPIDSHTPPWMTAPSGLEDYSVWYPWYFAPPGMEPDPAGNTPVEAAILRQIGEHLAVPVRYEERDIYGIRGCGELQLNDLRAIDRANRMLIAWSEAVEEIDFPLQVWLDCNMPKDQTGKEIKPSSLGPGAKVQATSVDETLRGSVFYPPGSPNQLRFPEVLAQVARVSFGSIPTMGLTDEAMANVSRLSGFAFGLLNWLQEGRIADIRQTAIEDGVLAALRRGLKVLQVRNMLPAGVNADDVQFRMNYGSAPLSEDERLKRVLVCESLKTNFGFPPEELISQLPVDIENRQAVLDGMEEAQKREEEMFDLAQQTASDKLKDSAGVDNNARASS